MCEIQIYDESMKDTWDKFVAKSKNGTFLFFRDYMDYHSDRFEDHSLLVYRKGDLLALLPAHRSQERLTSHGGLTFGGFVTGQNMKTPKMLEVFDHVLTYLDRNDFTNFVYKTIPHIYHRFPAEEDRYALFLCNAELVKRNVITAVSRNHSPPFQGRRDRGVREAKDHDLVVRQSDDFESYWHILTSLLSGKYDAQPVHSLEEIRILHSRFPDHIKLFACYKDAMMVGGVVIYESEMVARAQYIAANEQGYDWGALDLTFKVLLEDVYGQKPFFEFGTSNEAGGRYLNRGLVNYKEGFGARAVVHDHYEVDISGWEPGSIEGAMSR